MGRFKACSGSSTILLFGLLLAPTIFLVVIWHLLVKQNDIVNAERERQAAGITEFVLSSRTTAVLDFANWDELYRELVLKNNLSWFSEGVSWGMGSRSQRNAALLLDANGQALIGSMHDTAVPWSPHARFGPDFSAFFAQVRDDPGKRARSVFMRDGGQLAAVSLAETRSSNPAYTSMAPSSRRFLLFAEFIDGDTVAELRRAQSREDLTLTRFPLKGPRAAVRGYNGETVGYIGWNEPQFGRQALFELLPMLAAVLAVTGATITGLFLRHRRNTERLIAAERRAYGLAHCDALTGVANRRAMGIEGERLLGLDSDLQALMIDFDGFKEVNDRLGHKLGDALLQEMANRMRRLMPTGAILARMGGDEFAVLLPGNASTAAKLAEDVSLAISSPFLGSGEPVFISASIGVACFEPGMSGDELLRRADLAMYQSKQTRPGLIHCYHSGLDDKRQLERQMEAEMRDGLVRGEFWVAYQPIHSASGGQVAVEALARWRHPERGEIGPDIFIPIAERSRLIIDLGAFVLREACSRMADEPSGNAVSVNLSPVQLLDTRLVDMIAAVLAETGLAPHRLELEVTEGYLVEQEERAAKILHRLRELGVKISLDDFGCGYASVGFLRKFPLDTIKIDRSFVAKIDSDVQAQVEIAALVSLCRAFQMSVTVEGVETETQAGFLKALGCNHLQGYLYGKPVAEISASSHRRGNRQDSDEAVLPPRRAVA